MEADRMWRPPARDLSTVDLEAPSRSCSSTDTNQKPDFSITNYDVTRTVSRKSGSTYDLPSRMSTIPSRTVNFVDATVQCPICMEAMNTPKILPCLHNACKKCLQNYILSNLRKELQNDITPTSFPCPVCNEEIEPPVSSFGIEKWAAQFPTNFFLHAYGMILAVQREEVDCEPCLRRGESTVATWWCRECSEYQCNVCKTVHSGFKIFKHHNVIPIQEIARNPDIAVPKYEPCGDHKERIIKFCREHKTPCCDTCIANKHRKCDHVVSIEEEFNSLKSKGEFAKLGTILRDYEDMVNELIEFRRKMVEDLATRKQEIIDQVKRVREGFEEQLKRLEEKLLSEFEDFHSAEVEHLADLTIQSENLGKQISNAVKLVETVEQSGSQTHMVNLLGKVSRECEKYEIALREGQGKLQTVDYEFQIDRVVENVFKTAINFGNISIKRSYHKPENLVAVNPVHKGVPKELLRLRVWIAGDRGRCGIMGGAFLEDGRIILADFDNFKLKLFQGNGRLLNKLVLKSKPSDLAMLTEKQYVITFPSANGIQFIHLFGNIMKEGNYVDTSRIYHGVSSDGNKIYLVANSGVAICDMEGKEVNFIKPADHGVPTFLFPGYVRATPTGVIVTDHGRNSVFALTFDGRLINTYTHKDLNHPFGVDLDSNGNVFVCGKNSSNVHQLTEDAQRIKIILSEKDGIQNPFIARFQKFGNKFFVSESKISSRDYIKIFEWS